MNEEIERITVLLRRVLERRAPPKAWRELVARLPENDADDGFEVTVMRDLIGVDFLIRYVDAKDQESERVITVKGLGYYGAALSLDAFCHARGAARVFLAERIFDMESAATGEVIEDPHAWLTELSARNPTAETLERAAPGLQILACLAWCDGRLADEEWEVMLRYVDGCALTLDLNWTVIETFVRCVRPSLDTFDRAVARLRFQGWADARRIAAAGRELVLADGVLDAEEVELMERLRAYL